MKTNQTESTELDQQFEKVFVLDTNVILGDAQRMLSMSQEQSNLIVLPETVMTRIDKDIEVVCIGSNRQIDHPYINKHSNGLSVLLSACTRTHDKVRLFGTELTKVVRGRITEWAEKVFEDNK